MPIIRSISGLRATLGDSLTPNIVADYSAAFSAYLPEGKIILGNDGRPSSVWIEKIVSAAIIATGRDVEIIGMVPTPTVQLITEHSDAAGGIAITASHNPSQWNGLKFLNSTGVFLDKEENEAFWEILDNKKFIFDPVTIGEIIINNDAIEQHIDRILNTDLFAKEDLLKKIQFKNYKIVVDAVNASGSIAVPELLKKFNCEIIPLYCDATGNFPHTPEPLPEYLTELQAAVLKHKADIGIAVDPDADRLVLIDENGLAIGEEKTIAIAIDSALSMSNKQNNKAVVNLSTSNMSKDMCLKHNAILDRSPVGEINVVKKMKDISAIIGGEGSGGVILPECHYGRDSLVGIALLLSMMANTDKTLSQISNDIPKYEIIKKKIDFQGSLNSLIELLLPKFKDAEIDLQDGLRIDFEDAWVQVRASNTEPIIRIISEAKDKELAQNLVNQIEEQVNSI